MVRYSRNIKTLISVALAASLASSFTFTAGAVTKKAENDEIVLAAESAACTGKYNLKNDYDGKKGISIYSGEESAVSWNFNANAGKYTVTVVYHTEQGSGIDIVVLTPLHRSDCEDCSRGQDWNKITDTGTLKEYVAAIREAAEYYSLPVLDLYATSGLQPNVPVIRERYMPDSVHPNDAGHILLAKKIATFLKNML